jgi:hypothetical protein
MTLGRHNTLRLHFGPDRRDDRAMPALTRRRDLDRPQQCWRINYAGVHVGTIAEGVGNPGAAPSGSGIAGFIRAAGLASAAPALPCRSRPRVPHSRPRGACSCRRDADFEAWRDEKAWTERKHALWDAGQPLSLPGVH